MRIPAGPPVGFVVAYEYLWMSQAQSREDGAKTYPAAIVLATDTGGPGPLTYVVGVSHKPPSDGERALAVPVKLARHLGLDAEPCWIYTDQLNAFFWPGPDLRPADHLSSRPSSEGTCVIGPLPRDWFALVKAHVLESRRLGQLKAQQRTT